jgi:hypothetical protein
LPTDKAAGYWRLYVSVITVSQLRKGVESVRRRGDEPQGRILERVPRALSSIPPSALEDGTNADALVQRAQLIMKLREETLPLRNHDHALRVLLHSPLVRSPPESRPVA